MSVVCLAGMWLYAERVLIAHQVSDAAEHGRPRGNLSDLYPRWLGARELLLHGRDPYSPEVTREIQAGYYGRPIDPSRPEDPKDKQAFAYPVYIVFYLAPTVHLPFEIVRESFFWTLLILTVGSVLIWLRILRWQLSMSMQGVVVILTLGSMVVLQALKLQQMTLLVAALLAIAFAVLKRGYPVAAGILLALATVKPQLICVLLFWMTIWTIGDWKRRYRWIVSLVLTMTVLCVAGEIWLPHWIPRFWQAARDYQLYTDAVPALDKLLLYPWSRFVELAAATGAGLAFWRWRSVTADSEKFTVCMCLALATTLLLVPSYALYNQVLLIPAILLIVRDRLRIWKMGMAGKVFLFAVSLLLTWPWLSSTVLAGLSFVLPTDVIQKAWAVPGWTALTLPVAVAALMLVVAHRGSSSASRKPVPA
ncbi:MAG: DUF2029 domain-containing protein [Acidobacteria bacterium]|nr:DUF2029 domain-containing protein [Acidobacteriota bacterium]